MEDSKSSSLIWIILSESSDDLASPPLGSPGTLLVPRTALVDGISKLLGAFQMDLRREQWKRAWRSFRMMWDCAGASLGSSKM